MNAGCYGGETWSIVRRVVTVDHAGELRERTPAQYRIGYRTVHIRRCHQIASVPSAARSASPQASNSGSIRCVCSALRTASNRGQP